MIIAGLMLVFMLMMNCDLLEGIDAMVAPVSAVTVRCWKVWGYSRGWLCGRLCLTRNWRLEKLKSLFHVHLILGL